jgi:hypothetical protein
MPLPPASFITRFNPGRHVSERLAIKYLAQQESVRLSYEAPPPACGVDAHRSLAFVTPRTALALQVLNSVKNNAPAAAAVPAKRTRQYASLPRPASAIRKAVKKKESKFKPIAQLPAATQMVQTTAGEVLNGASILIVQEPWIELILDAIKTLEIRGRGSLKSGQRILLAKAGGGGVVLGSVEFVRCVGPLSRSAWADARMQHCVDGPLPYGASTYVWELAAPIRFTTPIQYTHKHGCVVWAIA